MPLSLTEPERLAAGKLIDLALSEDLNDVGDLTSQTLISEDAIGTVNVVAREEGILAGSNVAQLVFNQLDPDIRWTPLLFDGEPVEPGDVAARISARMCFLLMGERTALNFLTHLSGVASLTRRFVDAVAGTRARIFDTRKTLPGWRLLEKYAVRAGGGCNHRMGLSDGCLIKDNHLAAWFESKPGSTIADAVRQARSRLRERVPIEVEVDTLEQLADALAGLPDIVLLDNMDPKMISAAVSLRDETAPHVQLEASGGITLKSVAAVAATGVERISVGALTHSCGALDFAFDWKSYTQ